MKQWVLSVSYVKNRPRQSESFLLHRYFCDFLFYDTDKCNWYKKLAASCSWLEAFWETLQFFSKVFHRKLATHSQLYFSMPKHLIFFNFSVNCLTIEKKHWERFLMIDQQLQYNLFVAIECLRLLFPKRLCQRHFGTHTKISIKSNL